VEREQICSGFRAISQGADASPVSIEKAAYEWFRSLVRKCLGDFIGRAIRFHLRRFFDAVPLHLRSDSADLPDYSKTRSRIHTIVKLDGGGDAGGGDADVSISSAISVALQRIWYFKDITMESRNGEEFAFLAFNRAFGFINKLLNWTGVSDAIKDAGGWGKIESLATILQDCALSCEMPQESHFILLTDVKALLELSNELSQKEAGVEQMWNARKEELEKASKNCEEDKKEKLILEISRLKETESPIIVDITFSKPIKTFNL